MNIGTVLEKTAHFECEWNGEKIGFDALEKSLTPDFLEACNNVTARPRQFAFALSKVLTRWDLDWNGEPYPPTFENIARLPLEFLDTIAAKIAESWTGNPTTPSESQSS